MKKGVGMDRFSSLPLDCIAHILSLTSPRDVCRSPAISKGFKLIADLESVSDSVWGGFLPSDYREIILRSPSQVAFFTRKELYFCLAESPILLDGGNLSFSLEKESGKKSYMLGARELTIVWGDTPHHWRWISLPQSRFSDVAELLTVCWVEIEGRIETRMLSPNTSYVAYLVFKIHGGNSTLTNIPARATVRFVGEKGDHEAEDDDEMINRTVYLKWRSSTLASRRPENGGLPQKRKDEWMEIVLGEFFNDEGDSNGEIEMRLMETERGNWKSGLVVEGIELRPKVEA